MSHVFEQGVQRSGSGGTTDNKGWIERENSVKQINSIAKFYIHFSVSKPNLVMIWHHLGLQHDFVYNHCLSRKFLAAGSGWQSDLAVAESVTIVLTLNILAG